MSVTGPIRADHHPLASARTTPLILHVFSTFAVGGPQRRFAALARHFAGNYRHIVKPMDGRTDAAVLIDGVPACEIQSLGFPRGGVLATIARARRELARIKPDVLVTYNWGAMEWAAAAQPDMVRHIHIEDGFGPEEARAQFRRRVWFRRIVLNRHSTLVVPSRTLLELARSVWRIHPQRISYVPNGVSCTRFAREPDWAMVAAFRGEGPIIGTVAALRREKALDRLIAAFVRIRKRQAARLVIVGDGPERAVLEKLARDQGIEGSVTFTGAMDAPEQVLGGFDVFALSSDTEQMPLSLLEAMAAGRPVASTDAGDVRTMLAAENRHLVVPRHDEALAGAISSLLASKDMRENMGAANRRRALSHFDEPAMFAAYGRLFSGLT